VQRHDSEKIVSKAAKMTAVSRWSGQQRRRSNEGGQQSSGKKAVSRVAIWVSRVPRTILGSILSLGLTFSGDVSYPGCGL